MCYTNIKFSFFANKSIVLLFLFVNYAIYTTCSDSTSSFSRPILQSQNSHKHFLYKTQCPLMHMIAEEEYVAHVYMNINVFTVSLGRCFCLWMIQHQYSSSTHVSSCISVGSDCVETSSFLGAT